MKMVHPIKYHLVCAEIIITWRVFYKGNGDLKKARILSFGVNQMDDSNGKKPGIHAEYDALTKLIPIRRKKNLESINLLVVRLSSKNKIQSSKPCFNCIETMQKFPPKIGYKIVNVYYSNSEGDIIKTNLKSLNEEEKHYSYYFRRKLN